MQASLLPYVGSHPATRHETGYGGGPAGGGGARIGIVIGGRPGISMTWEPTGTGPPGLPAAEAAVAGCRYWSEW